MNRIILIGNGFDLAHGMKTSYQDFLDSYWRDWIKKLDECQERHLADIFYEFSSERDLPLASDKFFPIGYMTKSLDDIFVYPKPNISIPIRWSACKSFNDIIKLCNTLNDYSMRKNNLRMINQKPKSKLFNAINKAYITKWVDIENEYYRELKELNSSPKIYNYTIQTLNEEFLIIEKLLEKYLTEIERNLTTELSVDNVILKKIFAPFKFNDISYSSADLFIEEIIDKSKLIKLPFSHNDSFFDIYRGKYKFLDFNYNDILNFTSRIWAEDSEYENVMKEIEYNSIPHFFTVPEDILFLNFNYTHTIDKYIDNKYFYKTINIHGELNNKKNPIIFGYGDELEDSYKNIENINDNDYLKNVKSIRYLETDNYRRLLNFIESAPFQIFIMGHSCGNSDRTLLNTLFEHKNCISIKPFYHQKNQTEDNYSDIVRNISRNFTDKALMRDRVVNKMYCEPLS